MMMEGRQVDNIEEARLMERRRKDWVETMVRMRRHGEKVGVDKRVTRL
jgi:hypothetical protein